jgi:hypothetical protein
LPAAAGEEGAGAEGAQGEGPGFGGRGAEAGDVDLGGGVVADADGVDGAAGGAVAVGLDGDGGDAGADPVGAGAVEDASGGGGLVQGLDVGVDPEAEVVAGARLVDDDLADEQVVGVGGLGAGQVAARAVADEEAAAVDVDAGAAGGRRGSWSRWG